MPFITAFSDSDPVTASVDKVFQKLIAGCKGTAPTTVKGGGHFVQEDKGEELARLLTQFIKHPRIQIISASLMAKR